ncbi:MAG: rRNA maturation RNase YbeY [Candidatus Pacebacteria bacterium]|nr:rRNA maturation RNase YbeY [Candidatus Paceibacterota bacterium]
MIEIINISGGDKNVSKESLKKIAEKVLKLEKSKLDLSIALVNSSEIRKLNKKYRKKDKTTDVLSFGEDMNQIVICTDEVKKNGKDFKKELTRVLIHGVLHILGYEHEKGEKKEKEMLLKQEDYILKIFK